ATAPSPSLWYPSTAPFGLSCRRILPVTLRQDSRGPGMKWKIALSIVALSFACQASADEHRGGDAALGALSGAVVLGPIGAVAGAVVGYTAGPSIRQPWGFRRGSTAHHRARQARQDAQLSSAQSAPAQVTPSAATV